MSITKLISQCMEKVRVTLPPKPKPDYILSPSGLDALLQEEGYKNRVYLDTRGYPTIGVGHLLTDRENKQGFIQLSTGEKISTISTWSEPQVKQLLADDLVRFYTAVNSVKEFITQGQFDALVSFSFNVGVAGFNRSTAKRRIEAGLHKDVPEALLMWDIPKEIIGRRKREAAMYRKHTIKLGE